jgi:hypothetical protein
VFSSAERIKLLGRMSAVKSVHRNLQAEDAACKAMDDAYAKEILEVTPAPADGQEPMDIMAARDVHVYHGSPANSNNTNPTPVVQPVIRRRKLLPRWLLVD